MTCTTFVSESDFLNKPDHPAIAEWHSPAEKALGRRIAIARRELTGRRVFFKRPPPAVFYIAMIDLGNGQAQIVNFAPRDGSSWSINHYVPAQEIAAWLMGIVAGGDAN